MWVGRDCVKDYKGAGRFDFVWVCAQSLVCLTRWFWVKEQVTQMNTGTFTKKGPVHWPQLHTHTNDSVFSPPFIKLWILPENFAHEKHKSLYHWRVQKNSRRKVIAIIAFSRKFISNQSNIWWSGFCGFTNQKCVRGWLYFYWHRIVAHTWRE